MTSASIQEFRKVCIKVLFLNFLLYVGFLLPFSASAHVAIVSSPNSCDSADLTSHTSNQIDSRLSVTPSLGFGTGVELYTSRTDKEGISFTRNPNVWSNQVAPIDFTGVSGWNSYGGYTHGAALISPRNFLAASHFSFPNGAKIEFFDASGTPVVRTVTGSYTIPNTDINIGVLDSDVPNSITYYPLIASSTLYSLVQKTDQLLDVPIVTFNQGGQALVHKMNQINNVSSDSFIYHQTYTSGPRSSFSTDIVGGDSGQPAFIIIDGQPVFLLAHWFASGAENYGAYISEINQAMTDLNSGAYQVTTYNPNCFTSYAVINHAPKFQDYYGQISVNQSSISSTTPIATFTATDVDVGQTLTYSVTHFGSSATTSPLNFNDYFALDSSTGVLKQKAAVDTSIYGQVLNLSIIVTDDASNQVSSTENTTIGLYNFVAPNYLIDQTASTTITNQVGSTSPYLGEVSYDSTDKLLIGQNFIEGHDFFRLNTDGTLDTTFINPFTTSNINSIFYSNGKTFVAGTLNYGSASTTPLAEINSDGSLNVGFVNNFIFPGTSAIASRAFLFNNQIVVMGQTFNSKKIASYNLDGTPNSTFNSNILAGFAGNPKPSTSHSFSGHQWGNQLLIGGGGSSFNGNPIHGLIRLNEDGTLDNDFLSAVGSGLTINGFNASVGAMAPYSGNRMLVGGGFNQYKGASTPNLLLLSPNGDMDTDFNNHLGSGFSCTQCGGSYIQNIVVQSDNKILVSGQFDAFNGVLTGSLVRLNSNGTLDTTFQNNIGSGVHGYPSSISLRSDGALAISSFGGIGFDSQQYNENLNALIILTKTPSAPSAPLLTYASDTGVSHIDGTTASTTISIRGLSAPGGIVNIVEGNTPLATVTADPNGEYEATTTLSEGSHSISAFQVLAVTTTATSSVSSSTAITIDTTAPSISSTPTVNADTITISYSKDLFDFPLDASHWTLIDNGSPVHVFSANATGKTLTLQLDTPVSFGDSISLSYDGGAEITDSAGNLVPAFSQLSINNTTATTPTTVSNTSGSTNRSGGGGGGSSGAIITTVSQIDQLKQTLLVLISQLKTLATQKGVILDTTIYDKFTDSSNLDKSTHIFSRSLSLNMVDPDVKLLQMYLNTHGFIVAQSGTGSPGNENKSFGPKTKSALIEFQKANNILPATGRFGEQTRKFINGF